MSFTILRNKYSENLEMASWKARESSAESWGKPETRTKMAVPH